MLNQESIQRCLKESKYYSDYAAAASARAASMDLPDNSSTYQRWSKDYLKLARLMRHRLPLEGTVQALVSEREPLSVQPNVVINSLTKFCQTGTCKSRRLTHGLFAYTQVQEWTQAHGNNGRVIVANCMQEKRYLLERSRRQQDYLEVIEYDGVSSSQINREYEFEGLVVSHFSIEPASASLNVSQKLSRVITSDTTDLFPSYRIDKASPDLQWERLAALVYEASGSQ